LSPERKIAGAAARGLVRRAGQRVILNTEYAGQEEALLGITPLHAQLIAREHRRKPLPETVHLIGRQTVLLSIEEAHALLRGVGVDPAPVVLEFDRQTHGAKAAQQEFISDRTFFGLLGVRQVLAIDYSDYEGAEIILDLNQALPPAHRVTVDFLFGGSVLDNIFDPASYLRNVSELLRPGGRLFEHDVISQHHHPYCLVTPGWMFDYFVMNGYAACFVYVCERSPAGFVHIYGLDTDPNDIISDFGPPRGPADIGLIAIAEKGQVSSSAVTPIQDQYRSREDHARYRERLLAMKQRGEFFEFPAPTPLELSRLDMRTSKSFRYLGVVRLSPGASSEGRSTDRKGGLRIFEATYGGNCSSVALPKSGVSAVYTGNVTEVVASLFNGVQRREWIVDVNVLGDPAPQHPKDLEVFYSDLSETPPLLRRAYIPAEASGQVLRLPQ
jgi:hypothetical protein